MKVKKQIFERLTIDYTENERQAALKLSDDYPRFIYSGCATLDDLARPRATARFRLVVEREVL